MDEYYKRKWRVGRHVGRTVYLQAGSEPSDEDVLIGVMDTTELAIEVVDAVNAARGYGNRS
jgi:hypothetical protein